MRTYTLTDRDFEEFFALIEKIETESNLKYGDGPAVEMNDYPLDRTRRMYRYHFVSWRNRMMSGDSHFRGPDAPRDDMAKYLRQEIDRLTKLLPEEKK